MNILVCWGCAAPWAFGTGDLGVFGPCLLCKCDQFTQIQYDDHFGYCEAFRVFMKDKDDTKMRAIALAIAGRPTRLLKLYSNKEEWIQAEGYQSAKFTDDSAIRFSLLEVK